MTPYMTDLGFFPELPPSPLERMPLSGDKKLRARQDACIDRGYHPLTGLRILTDSDHTCRECIHRIKVNGGSRAWPKCDRITATHGPGTDCLGRWPACAGFEAAS
jgi:hypothetical protein